VLGGVTQHPARVTALKLPARSPNLTAFAERWVRSAKGEGVSRLILFGEVSLRRGADRIRCTIPLGAAAPREGKRPAVPTSGGDRSLERAGSTQRKAWRLAQVLRPRGMSELT
jgi:hypothetical protein